MKSWGRGHPAAQSYCFWQQSQATRQPPRHLQDPTHITHQKVLIWPRNSSASFLVNSHMRSSPTRSNSWIWVILAVVSYLENLVTVATSEPMTFFNISNPGNLRHRFAKFIANISQRHNGYVSLSMLYCLKTYFTWMMCFWTLAIGYLLEEIQIDLNVRFRDRHYAFEVG